MLKKLKLYVTEGGIAMTHKFVTSNCAYAIMTPVKDVFPKSAMLLDEYYLSQNKSFCTVVATVRGTGCLYEVSQI